jgi:proline iminopeptidase
VLNVEVVGPADGPVLLYIHGGPGQGAYDFLTFQRERLSGELRLVAPDQRGVLYSDPLPANATLTEHDLVADFEALREELGIETWTVLGHSFGGRLALRYAVAHPDVVTAAIFENPVWDIATSTQKLLRTMLPLASGETADLIRQMIDERPSASAAMWRRRRELMGRLGDRRMELYLHPATIAANGTGLPSESLPEEILRKGTAHSDAIVESADFTESLVPLLGKLTQPSLLILGALDPVTSDDQIDAFNGTVERFESASHFVQYEQPEAYARTVIDFVTARYR